MSTRSAIYTGWLRHRRHAPKPHRFRYRLFMLYLDLDELDGLMDETPLWSRRRFAPGRFAREDYLGDSSVPLATAVADLVAARTGRRPEGPIRMLAHLRYFGYCFNPVVFYYCFDAGGTRLETIVAHITNTPWGERHAYVLRPDPRETGPRYRFAMTKDFHVSPFLPMEMDYRWTFSAPSERLTVHMENHAESDRVFDATLSLERKPCTTLNLNLALIRYPLMTVRILIAIYFQAGMLWLKKIPFHTHPDKQAPRPTTTDERSHENHRFQLEPNSPREPARSRRA